MNFLRPLHFIVKVEQLIANFAETKMLENAVKVFLCTNYCFRNELVFSECNSIRIPAHLNSDAIFGLFAAHSHIRTHNDHSLSPPLPPPPKKKNLHYSCAKWPVD